MGRQVSNVPPPSYVASHIFFNPTPLHPSSPPPPKFIGGIPALDAAFNDFHAISAPASADEPSGDIDKASAGNSDSAKRAKVRGGKTRRSSSHSDDAVDSSMVVGGGKTRGKKSRKDDAVESSVVSQKSPPPKTHGSGDATTSRGKKARGNRSGGQHDHAHKGAMKSPPETLGMLTTPPAKS